MSAEQDFNVFYLLITFTYSFPLTSNRKVSWYVLTLFSVSIYSGNWITSLPAGIILK